MGPFAQILTGSELLAAYGDDSTAVLIYDTDTVPVNGAHGRNTSRSVDGKIVRMRVIFDRKPFEDARRETEKVDAR